MAITSSDIKCQSRFQTGGDVFADKECTVYFITIRRMAGAFLTRWFRLVRRIRIHFGNEFDGMFIRIGTTGRMVVTACRSSCFRTRCQRELTEMLISVIVPVIRCMTMMNAAANHGVSHKRDQRQDVNHRSKHREHTVSGYQPIDFPFSRCVRASEHTYLTDWLAAMSIPTLHRLKNAANTLPQHQYTSSEVIRTISKTFFE